MKLLTSLAILVLAVSAELDTSELEGRLNSLGVELPPPPSAEQGQKAFEEQCRKYGGEEAVERGKVAQKEMMQCVESLINVTAVQIEVEAAKPTGDLDIVFKKYCRKTPQLMDCATNLTHGIEGCLAEDQKRVSGIVHDVARTLLNFTCFKEGDRIALFIAEGGPECLQSKQDEIQGCLNATFGKYAENLPGPEANISDISSLNFPIFLFDEGQCQDIDDASSCVVRALEGCRDPTPANVVESVLKVIRRAIPCKAAEPQIRATGVTQPSTMSAATSLAAVLPSLLLALLLSTV